MAASNLIQIRPTKPGIACDFCEVPLTDFPTTKPGGAWSYVWFERSVGPSSFGYVKCSDCCNVEQEYLTTLGACVKRAHRHSQEWGDAVDRFIAEKIWTAEIPKTEDAA